MQSKNVDIYRLTAERTGKSEQAYKSLGEFVFSETAKNLRKPQSIIIKLKGVGTWYLRRKRMQMLYNMWNLNPTPPDPSQDNYETALASYNLRIEKINLFTERLNDYKKYIEVRDSIRQERYKTQVLITPKDEDN